ncbi:putative sec-independent protein translocase protein TatA/B/E [Helianthus annuus]|nr:putative sec-independent protein translocase protein TatA/B/E [Helianthus annuus]KAJ0711239.1 putative sec-independent protein translocase protein TatA/B/E [Helianthus annuus]
MASAIFNQPCLSSPSSSLTLPKIARKPLIYASLSPSHISCSRTPITRSLTLGFTPFSTWNGLRRTGFSLSLQSSKLEKRKKCKGKGVYASLFGVGAPEALVIGVVALLVFGPKGLAEEVSREFKTTLEKEIGLDELKNPVQGNYTSNTVRPPPDTLQNSQLTETPPAATATTEDSEATTTTPADGPEDSQETVTTSDVSPVYSQESVTTSDVSLENSQESVTTSDVSTEDLRETTADPAVTMEDSQPTVDTSKSS